MNENIFRKNLNKIRKVLKFAIDNPYSDFYRKKYKNSPVNLKEINSYEDFRKIPFLNKDEILAIPLKERTFVPEEEIARFSFSSGTTDNDNPLIIPWTSTMSPDKDHYRRLEQSGISRIFILLPPSLGLLPPVDPKEQSIFIPGDVANLSMSARLCKELGVQSIKSTPTILYFFLKYLEEVAFDRSSVKSISLIGEYCTSQKLDFFKKKFPEARIMLKYGVSEAGGIIGVRIGCLADAPPNYYHLKGDNKLFLEFINDAGEVLSEGEVGEIVVTSLKKQAFPLIRYKLADVAHIKEKKCTCGRPVMVLGGRRNYDVFKFHGVTIYTGLIEEALVQVMNFLEPQFQMHVYEKITGNKLAPKLKLQLKLKEGQSETDFVRNLIIESVSENLLLSPDKTLDYFVKSGIFLPLEIEFVQDWPQGAKSKNIISHLK